jgi:hypothetical protein
MKPDIYQTNSLPLASYLCTNKKLKFIGINKNDPKRIAFLFEPNDLAQKTAAEYFAGGLALELFQNYRALKDQVFEVQRNIGAKSVVE